MSDYISYGKECLGDATVPLCNVIKITAVEASKFAKNGMSMKSSGNGR